MTNGIYCETLLQMRPFHPNSFWYVLTFEREGDRCSPKRFFCSAELAHSLEPGDVYLFSAKGRYILRIADDVPVKHLYLEYFRLWLSFARKPYPIKCRNVVNAIEKGQRSDAMSEFIAIHSGELRACLPRFRHHWQSKV